MSKPYDGSEFPLSFEFKSSKVRAKAALDKEFRKARLFIVARYEQSIDTGSEEFTLDLSDFSARIRRQMLREIITRFPSDGKLLSKVEPVPTWRSQTCLRHGATIHTTI